MALMSARMGLKLNSLMLNGLENEDLSVLDKKDVYNYVFDALNTEKPSYFFETLKETNQLHFWFYELERLIGFGQSKLFHLEDAWEHTMMVLDLAAKERENAYNQTYFMFFALCHDLGKPIQVKEGDVFIIPHEKKSPEASRAFLERITDNNDLIDTVSELTGIHMIPLSLFRENEPYEKIKEFLDSTPYYNDVLLFSKCDIGGKIHPISDEERIKEVTDYTNWAIEVLDKYNKERKEEND